MTTITALLDRARAPLNDASKRRYSDAILTTYAVEGLRTIRRQRPDLFLGQLGEPFTQDTTGAAVVKLDDGYIASLADYITARAQLQDTEAKAIEKATAMLSLSVKGLA